MPEHTNPNASSSGSLPSLIEALQTFQANCPVIAKDTEAYQYKYAPLEKMLSIINPALHAQGLVQSQTFRHEEGKTILVTKLYHKSGAALTSELPLPEPTNKGKNEMHTWGGVITYSRRYAIKLILGMEPDMDMNMEESLPKPSEKPSPWQKPELKEAAKGVSEEEQPLTESERNLLIGLIKEMETEERNEFLKAFKKEFGLPAAAKIQGQLKAKKHQTFLQNFYPRKS